MSSSKGPRGRAPRKRRRAKCPECRYHRYLRASDGLCSVCAQSAGRGSGAKGNTIARPSVSLREYFASRAALGLPLFSDHEGRRRILMG